MSSGTQPSEPILATDTLSSADVSSTDRPSEPVILSDAISSTQPPRTGLYGELDLCRKKISELENKRDFELLKIEKENLISLLAAIDRKEREEKREKDNAAAIGFSNKRSLATSTGECKLTQSDFAKNIDLNSKCLACSWNGVTKLIRDHALTEVNLFPNRNDLNGIDPSRDCIPRDILIEKINQIFFGQHESSKYVYISSPASSGKTSLFTLYSHKNRDKLCKYISFYGESLNAFQILCSFGINIDSKQTCYDEDKNVVLMIDDVQEMFSDENFWVKLTKINNLHSNIRVLIASTHSLDDKYSPSPACLKSLPFKLVREDFLLSDECALGFINNYDLGLGSIFKFANFSNMKALLVEQCNGLVGALKVSMNQIGNKFRNNGSEENVIEFIMSASFLDGFVRCFGEHEFYEKNIAETILKCISEPAAIPSTKNRRELECFLRLIKSGILIQKNSNSIQFSSKIALRYSIYKSFPDRALAFDKQVPISEFIMKVISQMSASTLKNSLVSGFPKEAIFQHLFFYHLNKLTTADISVCSELSQIYPHSQTAAIPKIIKGEIDFYLNSNLRWGVELQIKGSKTKEHLARFDSNGKYYPLDLLESVVVDFRPNCDISRIQSDPRKITVVFNNDKFSECTCRVFNSPELITFKLKQ